MQKDLLKRYDICRVKVSFYRPVLGYRYWAEFIRDRNNTAKKNYEFTP